MWLYGDRNWILSGWCDKTFYTSFDCDDDCVDWDTQKAAKYTVERIMETYPPPYYLMCSGGLDSQCMIQSWQRYGKDFKVVSFRYVTDGVVYNDFDIEWLDKFVDNVEWYDFDVINFVENEYKEFADKYDIVSPNIATYCKMSEIFEDGSIIYGGNYITKGDNHSSINDAICGLQFYTEITKRNIIPFFLSHTPQIAYAFGGNHNKWEAYTNGGFDLLQPPKKFSGFEKIKDYYDKNSDVTPIERLKFYGLVSDRDYDIMFRYRIFINKMSKKISIYSRGKNELSY